MATRARRGAARAADPSGGNVLFTLGLVSVVALLIVGYVMTNGDGGTNGTEKQQSIFVSSTPSPVPTIFLTDQSTVNQPNGGQANSLIMAQLNELQTKVNTLETEKQTLMQQLEENKKQYNRELFELKSKIMILEEDNIRLSKERKGTN